MSPARMIAAENSVKRLERSGSSLRARHALAHVEHLDADHAAFAVEIEHDAWRHLFGDGGFDAFWAKPDKHRVGLWVIGSSDHRRAPRSKCAVIITTSSPSGRCTTRTTRAPYSAIALQDRVRSGWRGSGSIQSGALTAVWIQSIVMSRMLVASRTCLAK